MGASTFRPVVSSGLTATAFAAPVAIEVVDGRAEKLPFADESFDAAAVQAGVSAHFWRGDAVSSVEGGCSPRRGGAFV